MLYEADNFNNWTIQSNAKRVDLIDAIKLILNFNETKNRQDKGLLKSYDLSCDVSLNIYIVIFFSIYKMYLI